MDSIGTNQGGRPSPPERPSYRPPLSEAILWLYLVVLRSFFGRALITFSSPPGHTVPMHCNARVDTRSRKASLDKSRVADRTEITTYRTRPAFLAAVWSHKHAGWPNFSSPSGRCKVLLVCWFQRHQCFRVAGAGNKPPAIFGFRRRIMLLQGTLLRASNCLSAQ